MTRKHTVFEVLKKYKGKNKEWQVNEVMHASQGKKGKRKNNGQQVLAM